MKAIRRRLGGYARERVSRGSNGIGEQQGTGEG